MRLGRFSHLEAVRRSPRLQRLLSDDAITADEFVRWALQLRLSKLIGDEIPNVVFLKGQPLAAQSYEIPAKRWTSDIDILVAQDQIDSATRRLSGLGFEPMSTFRPWAYNQRAFAKPGVPMSVELHWRISLPYLPAPTTTDLIARSHSIKVGGAVLRTLDRVDTLLGLCLHFVQHLGELRVAMDIAAYLDAQTVDLGEARRRARAAGMERIFEIGVLCASPGEIEADPINSAFAAGLWELWEEGLEMGDADAAHFLMQCASGLIRDDQRLISFLRLSLFGPHRFGTWSAEFLRGISQNHFDRLTRID